MIIFILVGYGGYYKRSCDNKSLQDINALFGIQTDFRKLVIWIVSELASFFISSNIFAKFFGIVPTEQVIIGRAVTLIFH